MLLVWFILASYTNMRVRVLSARYFEEGNAFTLNFTRIKWNEMYHRILRITIFFCHLFFASGRDSNEISPTEIRLKQITTLT